MAIGLSVWACWSYAKANHYHGGWATMGLLGLTLALVGLYGLIAYSVSARYITVREHLGIQLDGG